MRRVEALGAPRARRWACVLALLAAVAASIALLGDPAASRGAPGAITIEPDLAIPTTALTMLGSASAGEPGETWAIAGDELVRYTAGRGWERKGPRLDSWQYFGHFVGNVQGNSAVPIGARDATVGDVSPGGGVAAVGRVPGVVNPTNGNVYDVQPGPPEIVLGEPGRPPARIPRPEPPLLAAGEDIAQFRGITVSGGNGGADGLVGQGSVTAVDDGGHTGLLVVPIRRETRTDTLSGTVDGILRWDGSAWSRERIEPLPGAPPAVFRPVAVDATGLDNAWMLAHATGRGVVLYRRAVRDGEPLWEHVPLAGHPFTQAAVQAQGIAAVTPNRYPADGLTVTADGVWVDATFDHGGERRFATLRVDRGSATVAATWCDLPPGTVAACEHEIDVRPSGRYGETEGAQKTIGTGNGYSSIAWPGDGNGTRVITSTRNGSVLVLRGDAFEPVAGFGGVTAGNAAFSAADDGWIGGQPALRVTSAPRGSQVQPQPLPVRWPLLAAAPEPGHAPGAPDAQAVAVGESGTITRFVPGQGWMAEEAVDPATGQRSRSTLHGVAWPEPDFAIAVGDDGAIWEWSRAADAWRPDEAAPPGLDAHLTGVAFQPGRPDRGYAVGRRGVVLAFDKTWTPEPLPADVAGNDLLGIAFAGPQALVVSQRRTYVPFTDATGRRQHRLETASDLLVNDGSGWTVDAQLRDLLRARPLSTLSAVDATADGGAVVAGRDFLAIRDTPGAPWRLEENAPRGRDVTAVGALRDGAAVRAMLALAEVGERVPSAYREEPPSSDQNAPPNPSQAFDPPTSGWLVRQTGAGFSDEMRRSVPYGGQETAGTPESVLSFGLLSDAGSGWLVGGRAFNVILGPRAAVSKTSAVFRYPATGAAPIGAGLDEVELPNGSARFLVAGNGGCTVGCSETQPLGFAGPELRGVALQRAAALARRPNGPRALLYTGSALRSGAANGGAYVDLRTGGVAEQQVDGVEQELRQVAGQFANAGLPVFPTPSFPERDPGTTRAGFTLNEWSRAFAGLPAPAGAAPPAPGTRTDGVPPQPSPGGARTHYAFDSDGAGGTVRVIVVNVSAGALASSAGTTVPSEDQAAWLRGVLRDARADGVPAIVVGNTPLTPPDNGGFIRDPQTLPGFPGNQELAELLADEGASAYFFDAPSMNRAFMAPRGHRNPIPTFGTGSLNYGFIEDDNYGLDPQGGFRHDSAGMLIAEVDVAQRDPETNRAPVSVRMIPVIEDLALDAVDGLSASRSKPLLFRALARRPRAGYRAGQQPYLPIPPEQPCPDTAGCASAVQAEYEFTSSDPDIGDFVARDVRSDDQRRVLLRDDRPVRDPASGLFCAFNAGTTTVTIRTGGLTFSQRVTVRGGAPDRPCGTAPLDPKRFPQPGVIVRPPRSSPVSASPPPAPPPPAGSQPAAGQPAAPVNVPPPPAPAPPPGPPAPPPASPPPPSPIIAVVPPRVLPPAIPPPPQGAAGRPLTPG
ncbi:MAG TPA: hypothetical protein VK631_02235, partial [Solirubrobacteraceae bacterium]|nr:hypothetical protein [Solirubrobacteraceae bacterium]